MDKIFRCSLNQHSPCIHSQGLNMLKVQPPPSHLLNEANIVIANFMCCMSLHVSLCSLFDKSSVYASVKWLIFEPFISLVVTSWLQLKVPDLKLVLTSSDTSLGQMVNTCCSGEIQESLQCCFHKRHGIIYKLNSQYIVKMLQKKCHLWTVLNNISLIPTLTKIEIYKQDKNGNRITFRPHTY